ncbi:MAG TPA: hypothetical protein VFW04_00775 [Gemmatimonadaceae bacterium]|nr:hypothetical protein [Gemmatimonadaceae bacterium]
MTTVDTRERFLRAIAERLSPERVEELHLFPPLRQGGIESAVAVIAARIAPAAPLADAPPPDTAEPEPAGPEHVEPGHAERHRLTVYRAHYRLVLKGPERGTWDVGLIEEADAPPPTVGVVVRGVHERAGGDDEPERLSGDAFRIAVSDRPWAAAG